MSDTKFFGIRKDQFGFTIDDDEERHEISRVLFFHPHLSANQVFTALSKMDSLSTAKSFCQLLREDMIKLFSALQYRDGLAIFSNSDEPPEHSDNSIGPISSEILKKAISEKLNDWYFFFDPPGEEDLLILHTIYRLDIDMKSLILKKNAMFKIHNPLAIKKMIDPYVFGNEKAKSSVAFLFYLHMIRCGLIKPLINREFDPGSGIMLPRPNMLIAGKTGTGKTFIIKTLAKLFDIPFVKVDCASLVSSGYVGKGINEYVYQLYKKCNEDPDTISKAIIYFDEIDKLSERHGIKGSVGGVELQQEFLSFLEDDQYPMLPRRGSHEDQNNIDTSNMMFIFSGAFVGIEEIIRKRLGKSNKIGFGAKETDEDARIYSKAIPADFIEYGLIPELIGRIVFTEVLDEPDRAIIRDIILNGKESPLVAYRNFFEIHADRLVVDDQVIELICDKVLKSGTGLRSVSTILHQTLVEYLFVSPNLIRETFTVTPDYFTKRMSEYGN